MRKIFLKHWGFFVILLLSLFLIRPLFHTGFFPVHDDTQVQRVFEMNKSIIDGMFPVRWVNDLGYGYGYPIFTFYAPLAYYIGGFFAIFVSALLATKLMIGIGIILSGIAMYLFARSIWGEAGGTLAGLLYTFAPYHALDIYVRGDIAEFWAYAMLPLVGYGLWQAAKTGKFRYVIFGAVGLAGIILSHNLTAFMVMPFLVLFAGGLLFMQKGWKRIFPILVLLFGIGFAAFYFLPVPFEMQYTNVLSQVGGSNDFHRHFVCLQQLWYSPWGYGGSIPGCIDGISFALGKIYIFLFIASLLLLPFTFIKNKEKGAVLLISILGFLFSVFMLLPVSQGLWDFIPQLAFLQYPWRFFIIVFFFLSLGSGSIVWVLQQCKKYKNLLGTTVFLVVGVALIVIQGKYFSPKQYLTVPSSFYTNSYMLTWTTSKISDEYMPKKFAVPQSPFDTPQTLFSIKEGKVVMIENKTHMKEASIIMQQSRVIHVNLAYFPGWNVYVDGHQTTITPVSNGINLFINSGSHIVTLVYKDTEIEQIGNILSITSIFIGIIAIIFMAKKKLL